MLSIHRSVTTITAAALAALLAGGALAQTKPTGKIVCWKDKSGKVVGCGDRVPPEYQDAATQEIDKRGVTRKVTESAEEEAKRKAREAELAKQKAEEQKRLAEQRRQDQALLNTFSNEKEIDLKRDRDLQVVDTQLSQLKVAHKAAAERHAEVRARVDASAKAGKPASDAQKEELARAAADLARAEQNIAGKEKEKEEIRKRYAAMKERYILLRGGGAPAPTAAAAPAKK
jgi:hypothetical protein